MLGEEETELLNGEDPGDISTKLRLVKKHLDLVVELADWYASETGRSFPQMVRTGVSAVIRTANNFRYLDEDEFVARVRIEIAGAMECCGTAPRRE